MLLDILVFLLTLCYCLIVQVCINGEGQYNTDGCLSFYSDNIML
jgi:hypothetical protein